MTDDNDTQRRWIPWSREKDKTAYYVGSVLGLVTAIVTSGSGVLRVDRFGYSDFIREIAKERLITEAQISSAIHNHEAACADIREKSDHRFENIERLDQVMSEGLKACRENVGRINEKVDYFQRRYWEKMSK